MSYFISLNRCIIILLNSLDLHISHCHWGPLDSGGDMFSCFFFITCVFVLRLAHWELDRGSISFFKFRSLFFFQWKCLLYS